MELKKAIKVLNKLPKINLACVENYYLIDGSYISATDLDSTIKIKIDELEFNKTICIISKNAIKKAIKLKEISKISFNNNIATIIGSLTIEVPYQTDLSDYPLLESIGDSIGYIKTPSYDISWYAKNDALRPILCSVNIDSINKRFVASDGHKLKLQDADIEITDNLIINKDIFKILITDTKYEVFKSIKTISFQSGDITIGTKEVAGTYPDVDSIIPKLTETAPIDLSLLKIALKEMLTFTTKSDLIKVSTITNKLDSNFNMFRLSVENKSDSINVSKDISAPNFEMSDRGFNGNYLFKILNQIDLEKNKFYLNNTDIGAYYFQDDNSLTLLMPLRILEEE